MEALIEKVGAVVIINYKMWIDKLFFYFTQLRSGIFGNSAIIITPNEKILLTSKLEFETAQSEIKNVEILQYEQYSDFLPTLVNILKNFPTIGVNYDGLPHSAYLNLEKLLNRHTTSHQLINLSSELETACRIKTNEELAKIRRACYIATQVANEIPTYDHPDEKTIAAHIEFNMRRRGSTSTWFSTIVGIGPNSADPHYSTGDRFAKSGEFLLTDFGPVYTHYGADITRTFIFEKPDSKAQFIYETVLQAQLDSLDAIHAGVIARDIDAVARKIIEKHYPDRFIHSLGHGLGNGGRIGPGSDLVLEPGMVFTIEPGVYLRDYGGVRIEDDIVVTKDGCELLTDAKKEELIVIPL